MRDEEQGGMGTGRLRERGGDVAASCKCDTLQSPKTTFWKMIHPDITSSMLEHNLVPSLPPACNCQGQLCICRGAHAWLQALACTLETCLEPHADSVVAAARVFMGLEAGSQPEEAPQSRGSPCRTDERGQGDDSTPRQALALVVEQPRSSFDAWVRAMVLLKVLGSRDNSCTALMKCMIMSVKQKGRAGMEDARRCSQAEGRSMLHRNCSLNRGLQGRILQWASNGYLNWWELCCDRAAHMSSCSFKCEPAQWPPMHPSCMANVQAAVPGWARLLTDDCSQEARGEATSRKVAAASHSSHQLPSPLSQPRGGHLTAATARGKSSRARDTASESALLSQAPDPAATAVPLLDTGKPYHH